MRDPKHPYTIIDRFVRRWERKIENFFVMFYVRLITLIPHTFFFCIFLYLLQLLFPIILFILGEFFLKIIIILIVVRYVKKKFF